MNPLELHDAGHFVVVTYHTPDDTNVCPNPRADECTNVGAWVAFHRRYRLGDKDASADLQALLTRHNVVDEAGDEYNARDPGDVARFFGSDGPEKLGMIYLPVYIYDHSGVEVRAGEPFSCKWDSGQVGYIYTTEERWRERRWSEDPNRSWCQTCGLRLTREAGGPWTGDPSPMNPSTAAQLACSHVAWDPTPPYSREAVEEELRKEIELYNTWQQGDLFGYRVFVRPHPLDLDPGPAKLTVNNVDELAEEDACFGFLGRKALDDELASTVAHLKKRPHPEHEFWASVVVNF